jgi:hypothetical protein
MSGGKLLIVAGIVGLVVAGLGLLVLSMRAGSPAARPVEAADLWFSQQKGAGRSPTRLNPPPADAGSGWMVVVTAVAAVAALIAFIFVSRERDR